MLASDQAFAPSSSASLTSISSPVLTSPPAPTPHLDAGVDVCGEPTLEISGRSLPHLPGIGDPPAPRLSGAFEQGAEIRNVPHGRPGAREVEFDRQGVCGTSRPAPVVDAATGAEELNRILVVQVRDRRFSFVRSCRGHERSQLGRIGLCIGSPQGESVHDALHAPVPPVIQQIGGVAVVAREHVQARVAGLGPRYDTGAFGRGEVDRGGEGGFTGFRVNARSAGRKVRLGNGRRVR